MQPASCFNTPLHFHDLSVRAIDGTSVSLAAYRGKITLIVNVASHCGYTPQYAGLEALYRKYRDRGLVVLGFPCNQFGGQEPGTEAEILSFCAASYNVTFPLFAKIDVNGSAADPLYTLLKTEQPGVLGTKRIKWNFTKFLVNAEGKVVRRYGPTVAPERIERDIETMMSH